MIDSRNSSCRRVGADESQTSRIISESQRESIFERTACMTSNFAGDHSPLLSSPASGRLQLFKRELSKHSHRNLHLPRGRNLPFTLYLCDVLYSAVTRSNPLFLVYISLKIWLLIHTPLLMCFFGMLHA